MLHKAAHGTYNRGMAKGDGKSDKTDKPDKSGKGAKSEKTDKRIDKVLRLATNRIETIESSTTVAERLANAAKSSELLSAVWSLPPAQRLMFHHGVHIDDVAGDSTPGFPGGRDDAERFITLSSSEIARYQRLLYANGVKGSRRRLLIVLQGMDASGKGGIVRHVFRQGDPMGIHYHGFGKPTDEETRHGFLWRVERELPKNGWIAVFDRSHYEDIVMPHVYGTYPEAEWRGRYDLVNEFERSLAADGCAILKIFLVVSQEEQKRHFSRASQRPDQILEVRHVRPGRARTLGRLYGRVAGGVREDQHADCAVVSGARRQPLVLEGRGLRAAAHHIEEHEHDMAGTRPGRRSGRGSAAAGVNLRPPVDSASCAGV